ncbi:MAG TPA: PAS domain S-box protein [Candidatus Didemnitutus sp.]|nr:PAS domain S-box protein [Candidatus Didemnitutus sp.]
MTLPRRLSPESTGFSLLLNVLVIAVVIALCWVLYENEVNRIEIRLRDRETTRTTLLASFMVSNLQPAAKDLRILATGDALIDYLATGSAADLDRAARRAAFISRLRPTYEKIRLLDESGREVIRVNRGGVIVPPSRLQDKSERPFYQRPMTIAPDQIYVSPFDLNVEDGKIELPPKPMIRFAMPVFNPAGKIRGVYVINVLGSAVLGQLATASQPFASRLRVLNSRGYWLQAADASREWGFALPGRDGFTLARTDPTLWQKMSESPAGQERRAGGLFTWQQVPIEQFGDDVPAKVFTDDSFVIVASEVTPAEFDTLLVGIRQIFRILAPGLAIVASVAVWFSRARQRIRRELQRSEENLSVTLHSIGDAVLATDLRGAVSLMNPVAEKLTGWPEAEARGQPIANVFRIIHETTRAPAEIPVARVLRTGEVHGLANHTTLISRDGSEWAIADSAAPVRDRKGETIGVVLVFRDVSAEREAERRIEAARSELDRFFTISLDLLCISSADGYFKRVSPAVTDILGWSQEEFLSRPYMSMVHPDDQSATAKEVERQVVAGEKVLQFENRYQHRNGSWRLLSWRSVPQPGGLMYASARDVTDVHRIHAEIRELNAQLQRRTVEQEAANRELEAFSYSVSHDLRAPLRHIHGYTGLLASELPESTSEKGRRYMQVIADSARSMGVLIDDLLAFSRMARLELREDEVDLNRVVQEARADLESAAAGRRIDWQIAPLPTVRGDHAMLRQVLANLLGNAVKYSRRKEAAVIAVGTSGEENGRTIFFVRDNGAGFDMSYAEKLFGVFQRLHRADEFEGTGIGLANVRRIISRHGGRTWAEGKVDAGATFYFTLEPVRKS